ncbi:MAG: PQQ-dependent sugar dehydrogenase [Bacteroidota bacterium]|nr:PQQ-dependent sugar dehydrogenase [Bacteroidota bacterium]
MQDFATGFDQPLGIVHAGDSRLFVVEQSGYIRILEEDGNVLPDPFLNISERVKSGGEQGLLGLAFHPDYTTNGYFYVNYTDHDNNTHIARFSVSETNPDQADASSEFNILTLDQPYANHNGGNIAFGPDGYLYIGTGDGGSGGDPGNRAQDSLNLLGKMLRIDINNGDPYTIPEDNPFISVSGVREEIWAFGLRNPWRYSFDSQTGDLWIADVGQNQYEEVNLQPAASPGGENYGWRCYEGNHAYNTSGCASSSVYTFPVHEYSHDATGGCSVTGGYVYRGGEFPAMQGYYFFSDYCNDKIWSLHELSGEWVVTQHGQYSGNNFSTFGEAANGKLYVAGLSSGTIYEITDSSSTQLEEYEKNSAFSVSPNPFRDYVNIKNTGYSGQSVSLKLFDLSGRLCISMQLEKTEIKLELVALPAGFYLLQFSDGASIQHFKLLKK